MHAIVFISSCEELIGEVVKSYHTRYEIQKEETECREQLNRYKREKSRLYQHFPTPESFMRASQPYKTLLDRKDENLENQRLKVCCLIYLLQSIYKFPMIFYASF
jgi:hypothetical protein